MKRAGSTWKFLLVTAVASSTLMCAPQSLADEEEDINPPEVALGERLFLETRFAQFFFMQSQEEAHSTLLFGDPVMDVIEMTGNPLPGPFSGQSMNCRACHLVDEQGGVAGGGNRTYADFARRSHLPAREDGNINTPRNAPPLVNAFLPREGGLFLHFDDEFASVQDLVKGTLTGRNFGWLPNEQAQPIAHIAHIIRDDDGSGELAQQYGGPSLVVLKGTDASIPPEFLLPPEYRIDVTQASAAQIRQAVAKLIEAYLEALVLARDDSGAFSGSPYHVFLRKNGLPRVPDAGETDLAYGRRLLTRLENLTAPQFVSDEDGGFTTHAQAFAFGPQELAGLTIFLSEPGTVPLPPEAPAHGKIGNGIACHAPPNFTDFHFHNTGTAQEEYEAIHGTGAFAALIIPDLKTRRANHNAYLPPNFPKPQGHIQRLLCAASTPCRPPELLPRAIALFKTPQLRDLGHSAPYLHTGRKDTLEDVIGFYIAFSNLARAAQLRNGAPELQGMALTPEDIAPRALDCQADLRQWHRAEEERNGAVDTCV